MKLKSLFLAGLAVMAMTSCSNEVEGVDNSVELEKDAKMQLAISFPQATATRAELNADQIGEAFEQKINDLTVIVVNNSSVVREYYTAAQLVAGEENPNLNNMTPTFDVSSGIVTVYAYANYGKVITTSNYTTYEETAAYTGLSISNNVASVTTENFHMNGSASNVTITAGTTNYALVNISRVAAKIAEATAKKTYTHEGKYGADLTITLTDYTLVNLDKKVKVLADDTDNRIETDFHNYYAMDAVNADCADLFTGKPSISIDAENTTSYCLANQSSIKTQVIYKAKAAFTGNVTEADGTFYIRNNRENAPTVYTLAQLQEAFPGVYNNYTAATTIADWAEVGVKKYAAGVCYYKQDVTTNGETKILRNNYYKLNVTNIRDLGDPEIDMPNPDPLTLLEVEVKVMPWTVLSNDIEL